MDLSGSDDPADPPVGCEAADELDVESQARETSLGTSGVSLEELVARLEQDPGECWRACEGLESVDLESRVTIIEGLAGISSGAGVIRLLRLLAASENPETRKAALDVQQILEGKEESVLIDSRTAAEPRPDPGAGQAQGVLDLTFDSSREIVPVGDHARRRLVNCLVTAVDGMGRGSVAISATRMTERCTAIFLCDVERGITNAIGQVEAERQGAGTLLEEAKLQAGGLGIEGIGELALRLLAGCLSLSGPAPRGRSSSGWSGRSAADSSLGRWGRVPPSGAENRPQARICSCKRMKFSGRARRGWTDRR